MPNHVTNRLEINADRETVQKVMNFLKGKTDDDNTPCYIDFNNIIPMPEELLMGNKFYCTGTTGTLILEALKEKHPDEEWDFTILKSGPLGGDQQMGSRIVDGQIDYLFFFTDPMTLQPHDTDVKALTRLAGVENIVFCCNRSTADHIISSPLFMDPDYERIHPDYSSYTKRFQDKPVVTEAVESVNRRKKKRK